MKQRYFLEEQWLSTWQCAFFKSIEAIKLHSLTDFKYQSCCFHLEQGLSIKPVHGKEIDDGVFSIQRLFSLKKAAIEAQRFFKGILVEYLHHHLKKSKKLRRVQQVARELNRRGREWKISQEGDVVSPVKGLYNLWLHIQGSSPHPDLGQASLPSTAEGHRRSPLYCESFFFSLLPLPKWSWRFWKDWEVWPFKGRVEVVVVCCWAHLSPFFFLDWQEGWGVWSKPGLNAMEISKAKEPSFTAQSRRTDLVVAFLLSFTSNTLSWGNTYDPKNLAFLRSSFSLWGVNFVANANTASLLFRSELIH